MTVYDRVEIRFRANVETFIHKVGKSHVIMSTNPTAL